MSTKTVTQQPSFHRTLESNAFWKDWKKDSLVQKIIKTVIGVLKIAILMIVDALKLGANYFSSKKVEPTKKLSIRSKIAQTISNTFKFSTKLFAKILIISAGIYFYQNAPYYFNEIKKQLPLKRIVLNPWK